MRIAAALGLSLTFAATLPAPAPRGLAQTATDACQTAPAAACVLRLARDAAGTDVNRLQQIADAYLQAGDMTAAAGVAREIVAILEAEQQAARAQAQTEPKDQIEARKRERAARIDVRNRVWQLVAAANLYSRLGDSAAARSVLERAQAMGDAIADPLSRSQALANIPAALARAGDMAGALALVERRTAEAIPPPAPKGVVAAAPIAACSPELSPSVRPVLDEQVRVHTLRPGTPSAMRKDLAVIALERGDTAQALSIARGITDPHQCFDVLKRYAAARAGQDDASGALAIADGLRNDWFRSQIMETIAIVRAEDGDIDGALEIARRIPEPGTRQVAIVRIATVRAQGGNPAAALAILDADIPDARDGRTILGRIEIALAFAGAGDAAAARRVLAPLREAIERVEGDGSGRGIALGLLGSAYARTLDPEGMAGFIRTFERPADRASLLALLAVELAIAGRREPASRALAEAREIADAIPDAGARSVVDPVIGRAEAALGNIDGARRRVASQPAAIRDEFLRPIIETLCAMRNHGEALRLAAGIANPRQRADQFLVIARSLAGMSR